MSEKQQVQDDLAFMKALVVESGRSQMTGGAIALAAGLLYGLQCLVLWAQITGVTRFSKSFMVLFFTVVSIAFLTVTGVVIVRNRNIGQRGVGTRAINSAFAGAVVAIVVLCSTVGLVAWSERSITIWLLYPVTFCVVQGAAWYVAAILRKRYWLGLVAVGWYATAVGLGLLICSGNHGAYLLLLAAALFVLLGLPGWVLMRQATLQ